MNRLWSDVLRFAVFKSLAIELGGVLARYGGWGLFAMSFLDSSFVPFPLFNDLALILLAGQHPGRAFFYAVQSTAGSVLGTYLIYGLARGGARFLWRRSTPRAVARAERWLKVNDFVALFVASLLPPPAPMKVFVLAAGLLRVNALHFGVAMLVGRGLRFGADAWLGAWYGARAEAYLRRNAGWASLVAAILVVCGALAYRWWAQRRAGRDDSPPRPRTERPGPA
jgi:membrane protein YqaA with SNARE-associated domain